MSNMKGNVRDNQIPRNQLRIPQLKTMSSTSFKPSPSFSDEHLTYSVVSSDFDFFDEAPSASGTTSASGVLQ